MNIKINKLGNTRKEPVVAEYSNKNAWFGTVFITNTEGVTIGIDIREVDGQLELLSKSNSLRITPLSGNKIAVEPLSWR
jgi:hypothetical protein